MGWWILWYVLFLFASFAVLFFYRVAHRTFVIYAVISGVLFFGWSWAKDTFPDLHRALPRALHDWQFTKAVEKNPLALDARKIVEEDCRDDETADTVKLNRDLQKYRELRIKNGSLSPGDQKARDDVLARLAEIEKKKAACLARVVPVAPRAEPSVELRPSAIPSPAPVMTPVPAPVSAAASVPSRPVSSPPPPPDLAAIPQLSPAPQAIGGNLHHAFDLRPAEWLNVRATVRRDCTTWRIEAPARFWVWFEDGRDAGRVMLYEKGQKYDMPPSAVRADTPKSGWSKARTWPSTSDGRIFNTIDCRPWRPSSFGIV